jgi:pilus assembly protein TadC
MFGNASLTISIIDTILNPDLTTSQKVGQIVINTAAFIGSYALSSDLVSTLGIGFVVGGPVIMLSLLLVTLQYCSQY